MLNLSMNKKPRSTATEPTDIEWAYLAGIFDGEGFISTARARATYEKQYVRVGVTQLTETGLCQWLQAQFGGGIVDVTAKANPRAKPASAWRLTRMADVTYFLTGIEPYLRVKGDTARVALAHCAQSG